jgi:hypothetical protein
MGRVTGNARAIALRGRAGSEQGRVSSKDRGGESLSWPRDFVPTEREE